MTTITFDTFAYVKRLKTAGFTETQAEALAEAEKDIFSDVFSSNLVTKQATKQDITQAISDAKVDIIKWVAAMLLAQSGLIAALVKLA
jgi:hypothetical protein